MTLYTIAGQVVLGAPIKGVIVRAAQILLERKTALSLANSHFEKVLLSFFLSQTMRPKSGINLA